jgi:hypothetical protein
MEKTFNETVQLSWRSRNWARPGMGRVAVCQKYVKPCSAKCTVRRTNNDTGICIPFVLYEREEPWPADVYVIVCECTCRPVLSPVWKRFKYIRIPSLIVTVLPPHWIHESQKRPILCSDYQLSVRSLSVCKEEWNHANAREGDRKFDMRRQLTSANRTESPWRLCCHLPVLH